MLQIAACSWALDTPAVDSLDRIRLAGFNAVDVRPDSWDGIRGPADLSGRGLTFGCSGLLPLPLPPGVALEDITGDGADRVLGPMYGAIDRAAELGAGRAYMVTPGSYPSDDARFMASLRSLATHAASRGVKLCIEPTPGRSAPDDASCLALVRKTDHENLHVLVDFGHCLITGEDPSASIRNAGDRLGYVHIDDNGGQTDDHYALFDGVLKTRVIEEFLDTLESLPYDGGVGLEFKSNIPAPMSALVQARDFIRGWEERRGA